MWSPEVAARGAWLARLAQDVPIALAFFVSIALFEFALLRKSPWWPRLTELYYTYGFALFRRDVSCPSPSASPPTDIDGACFHHVEFHRVDSKRFRLIESDRKSWGVIHAVALFDGDHNRIRLTCFANWIPIALAFVLLDEATLPEGVDFATIFFIGLAVGYLIGFVVQVRRCMNAVTCAAALWSERSPDAGRGGLISPR
jgi:hypothetical protein